MAENFPKGGSEYGGYPGLIQPAPHDPSDSPTEQLMLTYLTDPSDSTSGPEVVLGSVLKEGKRRVNE